MWKTCVAAMWRLTQATFTGAAILLREKAAYRQTSFRLQRDWRLLRSGGHGASRRAWPRSALTRSNHGHCAEDRAGKEEWRDMDMEANGRTDA